MASSLWHWWEELLPQFLDGNVDAIAGEVARDEIRDWLSANGYREALPADVRQSVLVETAFKWGLRVLDRVGTHEFSDVDFGWPGYDFSMFTNQTDPTWFGESGRVVIPPAYFRETARRPYASIGWERALAREFEQNSRDAGASRIDFVLDGEERTLEVADDGCGMSYATLKDKLLVMGGTEKAAGSVGGFGKAKELLFFAWDRFWIWTQQKGREAIEVSGRGADFEMVPGEDGDTPGTVCRIWFPEDVDLDHLAYRMQVQLGLSEGSAVVTWNGSEVPPLHRGRLVRSTDWCDLHVAKTRGGRKLDDPNVHIRLRGIAMFDRYIGSRGAQVVVELSGESLDVLNESRTELAWERRQALDEMIEEIVVDPKSALKDKPRLVQDCIKGGGAIQVLPEGQVRAAVEGVTQALKDHIHTGGSVRGVMNEVWSGRDAAVEKLAGTVEAKWALSETGTSAAFVSAIQQAMEIVHYGIVDGQVAEEEAGDRFGALLGHMCREPDFIVERLDSRTPSDSMVPPSWSDKYRVLARMWQYTVRRVLADAGLYVAYVPGFTFDDSVEARHIAREDGTHAFLLAPIRDGSVAFSSVRPTVLLSQELVDLAIHEAAHIQFEGHNEDFVHEMHRIRKSTRRTQFRLVLMDAKQAAQASGGQ